jgi:hypothetical protein
MGRDALRLAHDQTPSSGPILLSDYAEQLAGHAGALAGSLACLLEAADGDSREIAARLARVNLDRFREWSDAISEHLAEQR